MASFALGERVVEVQVNVSPSGQVSCVPDIASVSDTDVLVKFVLTNDAYQFASSGAVVISAGGVDFPYPSWTVAPKTAVILDRRITRGMDFKYTLYLVKTATGEVIPYDPVIRNEE